MKALPTLFLVCITQICISQGNSHFSAVPYYAKVNGISTTLKIEPGSLHDDPTEDRYYGLILGEDGSTYILMGDLIRENEIVGSGWDKFTGQEFKFLIRIHDSGLKFNFGLDENYGTSLDYFKDVNQVEVQNPGKGILDPSMLGTWRRTESYSDPLGGFSYLIEQTLVLNQDGTTLFYAKSAGGTSSVSGATSGQELRGYWKTEGQQLFTRDKEQDAWMNNGSYLVDAQNMMLKQAGGNKLWIRIK